MWGYAWGFEMGYRFLWESHLVYALEQPEESETEYSSSLMSR